MQDPIHNETILKQLEAFTRNPHDGNITVVLINGELVTGQFGQPVWDTRTRTGNLTIGKKRYDFSNPVYSALVKMSQSRYFVKAEELLFYTVPVQLKIKK